MVRWANSEVGHLTIARDAFIARNWSISKSGQKDGSLPSIPALNGAADSPPLPMATAAPDCLCSDGGVHSHLKPSRWPACLAAAAAFQGRLASHVSPMAAIPLPQSAIPFIAQIESRSRRAGVCRSHSARSAARYCVHGSRITAGTVTEKAYRLLTEKRPICSDLRVQGKPSNRLLPAVSRGRIH